MAKQKIWTEPTPESRADKVEAMIKEHWKSGEDLETSIMDLVADIMHLCHIKKIDFNDIMEKAKSHFQEELVDNITKNRGGKDDQCNTNAPSADIPNLEA
jgi:hypothetical protein